MMKKSKPSFTKSSSYYHSSSQMLFSKLQSSMKLFSKFVILDILTLLLLTLNPDGGQNGADCVRLVQVSIPQYAIRGHDLKLRCNYDLEGEQLYSIKWYRDGLEFYRYIPADLPKTTVFNGDGINVNSDLSTETEILMQNVNLNTSGKYKCEVSGEAPQFPTAFHEAFMTVVELPSHGPVISGVFPRYNVGDKLNVNCTSYRSNPPTKLKWYINGELADPSMLKRYDIIYDVDGLKTSVLGLRFKVRRWHFKNGDLKLKCTATISSVYWKSNEESVQGYIKNGRNEVHVAASNRAGRHSSGELQDVRRYLNSFITSSASSSHKASLKPSLTSYILAILSCTLLLLTTMLCGTAVVFCGSLSTGDHGSSSGRRKKYAPQQQEQRFPPQVVSS